MRVGRDDVLAHLGNAGRLLLDVRSPEEHSGKRVKKYGQFDYGAERGGRRSGIGERNGLLPPLQLPGNSGLGRHDLHSGLRGRHNL